MFEIFARHAAAACVLMFNTGTFHGEAIGEYHGDPLYHASLDPEEYRAALQRVGFETQLYCAEDWQSGGGRTVWLAKARGT